MPLASYRPAYDASIACVTVAVDLSCGRLSGQLYSREIARRISLNKAGPLSLFVMMTAPCLVVTLATRIQVKPSLPPPWLKLPTPLLSPTLTPRPYEATCRLSIRRAISDESTLPGFPSADTMRSIAKRARSDGVVHSPAAAISG